jgi:uncharacterized protein
MTQYDQQYPAPTVSLPPAPAPRRLALELVLDLLILLVALFVTALGLLAAIIGVRVAQQQISPADLAGLSAANQLELIGVGGVFLVLLVQNLLFIAVPLVRTRLLRREPLAAIGLQAPSPLRLVLFGFGLGALVLVGNALLGLLFSSLGIRQNQAEQYPLYAGDYMGQALFMLGAAVIVPIGEEILFRGYLFGTLRRIGAGRSWGLPAAYLVSAVVFGLAHSLAATQGIVGLIVPTTVMGLLLAWGVQRTGSVLPSIVAHSVNNGVALIALVTCVNNPGMCPGV